MLRTYGTTCADPDAVRRAYDAPFPGPEWKAGVRRFPWCLPFAQPVEGNAADQARCYDALTRWSGGPIHLVWGGADPIFPLDWAEAWRTRLPGATLDVIDGASHFVAEERGEEVAERLLARMRS
jgi:haloalkane dehalogenase